MKDIERLINNPLSPNNATNISIQNRTIDLENEKYIKSPPPLIPTLDQIELSPRNKS